MLHRIRTAGTVRLGLAVLLALTLTGVIGVLSSSSQHGRAHAATQVLSTTDRGLCIKNGTGAPQSLWLVDATGECPSGYWGPASLKDAFGIDLDAIVKAEVARQLAAKAPAKAPVKVTDPADGDETAPVLARKSAPGLTSVPLKWTAATPPAGDTVVGYQVRYRQVTDTTWGSPTTLSNVLVYTVNGLTPETSYFFQVRARYSTSTDYGDWSNTLSVATGDVA